MIFHYIFIDEMKVNHNVHHFPLLFCNVSELTDTVVKSHIEIVFVYAFI